MDNATAKSLYDCKDAAGQPWFYSAPDTNPWINFVKRTVLDYEKIKDAGQATATEFNNYAAAVSKWLIEKIETKAAALTSST